jgi:hypothetical protein
MNNKNIKEEEEEEENNNNIYQERTQCVICNSNNINTLYFENFTTTMSLALYNTPKIPSYKMPYNVLSCENCNSCFTKYVGNLKIVYEKNHIDNYGTSKCQKHLNFSNFITSSLNSSENINGIIEIGSCNGELANSILKTMPNIKYTIIEPSYIGNNVENVNVIPEYIENVEITDILANTMVLSDVFEHFYNPTEILEKIKNSENIQYIYMNHPDFDYFVKNNNDLFLNFEHTFIVEHSTLFDLFYNYGFKLCNSSNFKNTSLFLKFERIPIDFYFNMRPLKNKTTTEDVKNHFDTYFKKMQIANEYMNTHENCVYYIWPASFHTINLFTYGFDYTKLSGILDNSPHKIGKYLYGYNLLCESFNELLTCQNENVVVFIPNTGTYIDELDLTNTKLKIICINDL